MAVIGDNARGPAAGGRPDGNRARRGRRASLLAVVALVAVALPACGSSSSKPATGGGTTTTTAPAAAAPAGGGGGSAPGVTATTVTIGQIDDLSAPVPGLFKSAQDGTQAYVNYINSTGGVNGRKLVLDARDSAFSPSTVTSAAQAIAANDLAFVGGYTLLDSSIVPVIDAQKVPLVGTALSSQLVADTNAYSPVPSGLNDYTLGPLEYFKQKYPQAIKHVGVLYANATPSAVQGNASFVKAAQHLGYNIVYQRGFGPFETTFLPDVLKMKQAGVQMFFSAIPDNYAATIAKEFATQGFHPINIETASYGSKVVPLAGSAADGMYFPLETALYLGQDSKVVPEVAVFDKWMHQVDPQTSVALWGLEGWASAELFVDALKAAGPNPTRQSLTAALNNITSFNANGLVATSDPAHNVPPNCWLLAQVKGTTIERVSPSPKSGYICSPDGHYNEGGFSPMNR